MHKSNLQLLQSAMTKNNKNLLFPTTVENTWKSRFCHNNYIKFFILENLPQG